MLLGEYEYRIDQKGRVAIPVKLRTPFQAGVTLTRGIEQCILVHPVSEWKKIANDYDLPPFSPSKNRRLIRAIFSKAFDLELDRQGRVALPSTLRQYAQIKDTVVIAGANKYLEIWDKELWEQERVLIDEQFWQLAEGQEQR